MDLENLYGISPEKVSVIPAGVDTDIFYPVPKLKARVGLGLPDKEMVMYAGRVEPIKGLDILLDSFKILNETRDVHLVVVGGSLSGDRELDALRQRSKQLGILEKNENQLLTDTINKLTLPILPFIDPNIILSFVKKDKKIKNGILLFVEAQVLKYYLYNPKLKSN